jgi:hypothetical protein
MSVSLVQGLALLVDHRGGSTPALAVWVSSETKTDPLQLKVKMR